MPNQSGFALNGLLILATIASLIGAGIFIAQNHYLDRFFKPKTPETREFNLNLPSSTTSTTAASPTKNNQTSSPSASTLKPSNSPSPTPTCTPKFSESTTVSLKDKPQPNLVLKPNAAVLKPKSTFSVDVYSTIEDLNIQGVDFTINYNPNQLQVLSIVSANPDHGYGGSVTTDSISIAGSPIFNQDVKLSTITFKVADSFTGKTELKFDPSSKITESKTNNNVLSSITNGVYIIGSNPCPN